MASFRELMVGPGSVAVASAVYGATTLTSGLLVPHGASKLGLFINVTAASGGSPTLDIDVEWSSDGGTTWFDNDPVDEISQLTAISTLAKQFTVLAPDYRLQLELAGTTPSFTVVVDHVGLFV